VSELSEMKSNLVDRTCELLNHCATTESYTIKLLESSYGNIPSCSSPNHSSDVVKWSSRGLTTSDKWQLPWRRWLSHTQTFGIVLLWEFSFIFTGRMCLLHRQVNTSSYST